MCKVIFSQEGHKHQCCMELQHLWLPKVKISEKDVRCVTETEAFITSMAPDAVRNYLLLSHFSRSKDSYATQMQTKLADPPTNALCQTCLHNSLEAYFMHVLFPSGIFLRDP